jgi:hypothetical protein
MLSDAITTETEITIREWRVLSKLFAWQPEKADVICAGCSKPRQLLQVYKLNADIEANKFLSVIN